MTTKRRTLLPRPTINGEVNELMVSSGRPTGEKMYACDDHKF